MSGPAQGTPLQRFLRLGRITRCQISSWYGAVFSDDTSSRHQAALTDHRAAEQNRTHADQGAFAYPRAVQDGAVTDGDVVLEHQPGLPGLGMRDYIVLDVAIRADADRREVGAQHGAEPDAGILSDLDVANDGRVLGDERARRDAR